MVQMKRRIKKVSGILIPGFILVFFFLMTQAAAEAPEEAKETTKLEKVQGEVVLLTPEMISIEFGKKDYTIKEILIPLDQETQFTHLKDLEDIQEGDTVRVNYKEVYTRDKSGKRTNFKRVAVDIALVRRAKAKDALTSVGD